MSDLNEDRDRQIVPRWRAFASAAHYGELVASQPRVPNKFTEQMLAPLLDDWRREPGLSVAADVVSAAFVIGHPQLATEPARYLIEQDTAPPAAREIASRCLAIDATEPSQQFLQHYAQPAYLQIQQSIHQAKDRLRQYPPNPVRWANLALFYTTLGQHDKATSRCKSALTLAPNNRFIVRAASRLFLHQGDIERAHSVLLKTTLIQSDPWIVAGELAIAAIHKRPSRCVKRARGMAESQNYSPFNLSELAGALATMEAHDVAFKKARRLCSFSLLDPSENAIAQAAWLDRKWGVTSDRPPTTTMQSSEANAWLAFLAGDWTTAMAEARQWQADQPFSSRPALCAGLVASWALERFDEAETVLRQGLRSNLDDATLYNNLAFVLANQGKLAEAIQLLDRASRLQQTPQQTVCLTATRGLTEFRLGHPEHGRAFYRTAIRLAHTDLLSQHRFIATIYFAIEELREGSPECTHSAQGGVERRE